MLKALAAGLLISSIFVSVSFADNGFSRCNCDDDGSLWSIESILECQRVSDFLIAVAYFSIPIELLYFVSCTNVPFKWVLFQFIAFIVLCGLTHLLNGWTYGPHTFQLMLALTVFKILTALVSCATAITLFTLIPLLLKVKVREFMLKKKTWDLGREVGIIMKQKEAGLHVRMLTQEIRKSLDRHNILYTTLVELSKTLGLQNCAVWMPNDTRTEMNLTHELKGRNYSGMRSILITDPDVVRIKGSDGVAILRPDSALAIASSEESHEAGSVAAIRMPMLRVCNFKGGTPEVIQACYAILVLVLPSNRPRSWSTQELEIVKGVADQVAVALSHAAVLEESQLMRDKLAEQNQALQLAQQNAMMASQARNAFQKVMSNGMRRPMHSISGLLSLMQDVNLSTEQQMIVHTMLRTSNVLSTLINDVMDISTIDSGRFPLEIRSFRLHSMIKEVACLARCLCVYGGFNFSVEVERSFPDHVIGDERRIFQVILHMVGNLLNGNNGGTVTLRIFSETASQERNDQRWATWRQSSSDGDVHIRFDIGFFDSGSKLDGSTSTAQQVGGRYNSDRLEQHLSFSICKKLVQLMQGNIWVVPNPQGFAQSMALVLRFQVRPSIAVAISESGESSDYPNSNSLFRGLRVLLADHDDVNRAVTRKLLQKLGCIVTAVSSGFECLSAIGSVASSFQVVLMDLQMPELDGFEVAMRIRKFRSRSLLIIALTASADGDVWEKCKQIGMNGVIRKPVQLQGIANELRRILLQSNEVV
ncbi:Response_reg domain-containing protein/HisKA domain-containing protein/GAF domain-containing protein/HATPase_c domain-containing protein [Cephalotus follicularis]|uniref:Ethylene receptor n=1 Tax=Cephalotus follicularis TaxID=3775 RepID=A0A1Q3CQ41_CEPFO|nr:Response_reg domain-containing protein/HisKA domain-containing protein/GAF domain-containing protein/HATPase_c domain-containing protein [Cephalotus follicularis]